MSNLLFELPAPPAIPVHGENLAYPVHRIFCVGRNYAAHAAEMGAEVDREAPFYFTKSPASFQASGTMIPYPPGTNNFHYEMEMVIALGKSVFMTDPVGGIDAVFGYGCGLDMTRRDLQQVSKDKGRPWDTGKDVEHSAVFAPLTKAGEFGEPGEQKIQLLLNGEVRQDSKLSDMIWKTGEIIAHLSSLYHLVPGDLIMTGTPAGVGPVKAGDKLVGQIDGLTSVTLEIGPPDNE